MAHLATKATHRNPESRLHWKLNLVRRLFERGYSRENIQQLFRFIDWLMVLPQELTRNFQEEVKSYEEAKRMRYVTSIERLAKEDGKQEGIVETARESAIEVLKTRFGEVPKQVVDTINLINDVSTLKNLHRRAITIASIEEFQQVLQETTS